MNNELKTKTLNAAKAEVNSMLEEHWDRIVEAMGEAAIIAAEGDAKKFNYGVNLACVVTPRGDEAKIEAKISYKVSRRDVSVGTTVSNQPELQLEDDEEEGVEEDE